MDRTTVTVGIDIGTTSVKAVAADADGAVVASTRVEHPVLTPEPGVLEHDAALAWHHGVRRAAVEVAEAAVRSGCRVAAVNVAAMVPSLCPVDDSGMPVGPGLLYGDRRAAEAATAAGHAPSRGLDPSEDGELVRMLGWLAARHPDAAGYWPAQAVANAALCGVGGLDTVTAMTTVPLFDWVGWDAEVCREAGARPDQLPVIVPGSEAVGRIGADAGLGTALEGAVVGAGTIDAFAEQLVAGADHDGDVLLIMGATLITWACIPEWHEAPGLWTVPHTAPGKSLIGGPSNAGGIARNWAASVLAPGDGRLPDDPAEVPVFLPHVRGERVPLHDPGRRGGFDGLSVAQGPGAMWRAVFEASGMTVRRSLDLAGLLGDAPGPAGTPARRIVATGGGSADDAWVQAVADVTGLPVDCVAEHKGGALGSAYVARAAAGLEPDTAGASRWARVGRRIEPDPAGVAACAARYRRFVELAGPPFDRNPTPDRIEGAHP
jgi:xylulokinase